MKLPNQCCYKCEKRHSGCHSTCEEYITSKAELEKIRSAANADSEINAYTSRVAQEKRKRWSWKK